MPRVPTYQDNVPGVIESGRGFGGPVQNVIPSFDYESVMNRALQPINQLADTTVKLEAHYRDTVVKARADEELDAYDKEIQDVMYSPDTGYYAQQGKNAVETWDKVQEKLQSIYDKRLGSIEDEDVKTAFKSVALQKLSSVREQSISYRNRQNIQWRNETSKAHLDNLVNEFAIAEFGPDSERTLASIKNEVEYQARLTGNGEDWKKMQTENYISLAFASAYANMATKGTGAAEQALKHIQNVGSKHMSPEVLRKTMHAIFPQAMPAIAQQLSMRGGTTSLSLTPATVGAEQGKYVNAKDENIAKAQKGLGEAPKVSPKVLNTSGYKSCNPLNIRAGGDKWQGAIGQTDKGYLVFSNPVDGIRAASKIIQTYSSKYGINTIEGIINRFAPASENPTAQYIANVCKTTGFDRYEKLDVNNPEVMGKLLKAMMKQEIGDVAYSDETIITGIQKAQGKEANKMETSGDQDVKVTNKISVADLAYNLDAKTGYDVYDNLLPTQKMHVLQYMRQQSNQNQSSSKTELRNAITKALTVARTTGDSSQVPDVSDFVSVFGQSEGVKQHQEIVRQSNVQANMFKMAGMTDDEMVNMGESLVPSKDDPFYVQHIQEKSDWDKAVSEIRKRRADDPVLFAMQGMPQIGITPIQDWANIDAVAGEFVKRRDSARQIAESFKTQPAMLTKQEIAAFTKVLSTMDADRQGVYIQKISDKLNDSNEPDKTDALRILAQQFGDKNNVVALAFGVASSEKGKENNLAMRQIKGNYYRKQKMNDGYKDEVELRNQLDGLLPFSEGDPAYDAAFNAIMNDHCYSNQEEFVSVDKSIENVFSKVEEYNGGKIFLPTKLEKLSGFLLGTDFDDIVEDARKDISALKGKFIYGGMTITGVQLSNLLENAQLQWISDGQYQIKDGLRYVTDEKGIPFVLDLNPYLDKRIEKKK